MQKFSNMPLSEVASAAVPAARRVAVPTAKPASLSAEALNIPRSGIRDVFDRVERVPDAISLTVGEPSATAAPHIVAAACEAAQAGRTRYTNVLGVPEYRKAVADYSARVKGLTYDPETEIQAVDGATIGLFLALKAVVGTGDEVIIPSPFFTSYDAEVMLCGGRPVTVALRPEHGMRVNAADIEAAITPRTRAVIINSPGNPTGAVTSAAELARIAEVCKQHNIWAISDEVYHPFVFGETFGETLGGEAAVAALAGPQDHVAAMREEYRAKRQIVLDGLAGCPVLRLIEPQGAFYAFVDVRLTGLDSGEFADRLLDEEHVAVVPGEAFGEEGRGFVRLSYAGDAGELREGVARLRAFAERVWNPITGHHTATYHPMEVLA